MASEALIELMQATLALTLAMAVVALVRSPLRRWLGAQAVYASWALAPLSVMAVLLPAPRGGTTLATLSAVTGVLPAGTGGPSTLPLSTLLLGLWLLGAIVLAMVMVARQLRFHRTVQRRPAQAHDVSPLSTPAVAGLLRPRVVLPADFASRYTAEEQRLVIAHEQLHIERGDIPAQALATALRCLFWFHPLVHLAAARFRFDQELACDADVLARHPDSRRRYGEAMFKTQLAEYGLPVGCHWQSSHPLKERVAMLNQPIPGKTRRRAGSILVASLLAAATFSAWAAQPAAQPATPTVAKPLQAATDDDVLTRPKYPASAIAQGISGRVDLEVLVGTDGRPEEIRVVNSSPEGVFDKVAVEAAQQWRFNAGRDGRRGEKVEGWVRIPVQFSADDPPEGTQVDQES